MLKGILTGIISACIVIALFHLPVTPNLQIGQTVAKDIERKFLNFSSTTKNINSLPELEKEYAFNRFGERVKIPSAEIKDGSYLHVDLDDWLIVLFNDGKPRRVYELLAKGTKAKPSPVGNFSVKLKKEDHFSSIYEVWMPWSIHFYDDYFIHGLPYWEDGSATENDLTSAGCLRLSVKDAKELYSLIDKGTPVITRN